MRRRQRKSKGKMKKIQAIALKKVSLIVGRYHGDLGRRNVFDSSVVHHTKNAIIDMAAEWGRVSTYGATQLAFAISAAYSRPCSWRQSSATIQLSALACSRSLALFFLLTRSLARALVCSVSSLSAILVHTFIHVVIQNHRMSILADDCSLCWLRPLVLRQLAGDSKTKKIFATHCAPRINVSPEL